jgi:hypothetical protein
MLLTDWRTALRPELSDVDTEGPELNGLERYGIGRTRSFEQRLEGCAGAGNREADRLGLSRKVD